MFERLSRVILKSELLWLYLAAFFIIVPTNLIVGATTAVVLNESSTWEFVRIVLTVFVPPLIVVPIVGGVIVYPFEKLVVQDKALTSLKWVAIRAAFTMLASIPIALILLAIVTPIADYLPESVHIFEVYLAAAVLEGFMISIAFAFFEYVFTEIAEREAKLSQQLQELRMEIDVIKKDQAVAEITESDDFLELKARAQELRNKNNPE